MNRLSISSTGPRAAVELNGHDISSCLTGISMRYDAWDNPTAVLDVLVIHESTVSADDVKVTIPGETAELLVKLGWTPPAAEQTVGEEQR